MKWIVGYRALSPLRPQLPPVEVMATPYHTLSWLGPPCASRTHKNTFSRLGVEDEPATQVIQISASVIVATCSFVRVWQ